MNGRMLRIATLQPYLCFLFPRADERCHHHLNGWYVPPMTAVRQTMGKRGERVAEKWLAVHGWQIAERRFRNGHRDIDLVATKLEGDARTVAFVEVKTRATADFGGPVSAVNWRKQRELSRSAKVWMSRFQRPGDTFRFDVIGVILGPQNVRVQHVENAFLLPAKS
jgi:putative endonuclease